MTTAKTWIALALAATLLIPAAAQDPNGEALVIRSIDIAAGAERGTTLFAMLGKDAGGIFQLALAVLREQGLFYFFKHSEGGHDLVLENTPSSAPDVPDAFLLDAAFRVHHFPIASEADGSLRIEDPVAHGPFGDPRIDGEPVVIAMTPSLPPSPIDPWIAIGTDTGRLILIRGGRRVQHHDLAGAIADLTVVPQVGSFAFVALVNNPRDGKQHLVGILPPPDDGTPARIVFDLTGRSGSGLVYSSINLRAPGQTFDEPAPVSVMAADGTHFVHRLTIPPDPPIGGNFDAIVLDGPHVSIVQVAAAASSGLAMLPADGAGVLHDAAFNLNQGGVSSMLSTVFGNSAGVSPFTYKVKGRAKWTNITLEGHINRAALMDAGTLVLHAGARSLPVTSEFSPKLGDADGDGNLDLTVRLDRATLLSLVNPPPELDQPLFVTITCTWGFVDGSNGFASALIKLIP